MCIQVRIIGIRVRITSRGRIAEVVLGCSRHYIDPTSVLSGVPQGTVSGLKLFLIYIDDITRNIESQCKLFADDMKVCKVLRNVHEDTQILKNDLNTHEQ